MKIKNIFFDFDGVIAESVNAKTQAFKEMYSKHGTDVADKVVDYHINNGGVSRFEKFKYWEKEFFNRNLSEREVQQLANEFSKLVLDKVIHSDEVDGVGEFLKKYSKTIKFWIITGTPTTEITIITDKRALNKYFVGIHGSPENKMYWTEHLIKHHNLNREETLFLGDATTDYDAATHSKLHFALRDNEENSEIFKDYSGLRFCNFNELENLLLNKKML
jgi:phosphoglycolate phosphatase-like HAD superfamily hydrolase